MKVNLFSRGVLFFAALIAIGANFLSAQTFVGGVRGLVQDPAGAAVAEAKVTLINPATNVSRSAITNEQGEYTFAQVEPGGYSITIEAPGFKMLERKDVVVATQEFLTMDFKLQLGEVSDSVQVNSEVPLIENSNASNGQVLTEQQVDDLPNLGRNVFLLSKLATNVEAGGDPRFNRMQDQSGSSQISVGGGPIRGNNYFIDGIPVTDSTDKAIIIPTYEAVQEMKIQTGTYDATMGRTGGGVFNTYLKSGTNDFHGEVFGYYRTTDFTANQYFNNAAGLPRDTTSWKNFGGGMGGPVVIPKIYNGKNKTFFYVAQEAYRQHTPVNNGFALPTALEKTGNFSQSSVVIYDPLSARPCAPTDNCPAGVSEIRTPFPGNIIPASRINPIGQNIINYLPNPQFSAPTDAINYSGTDSLFDRADQYTYKLDESVTDWLRLTGSSLYYKSREPGGNPLGIVAGSSTSNAPYLLYRRVDATAVNAIMTLNPTTVATLRYGFNRFPNVSEGISAAAGFNEASLGFPASYLGGVGASYFPSIGLDGESLSNISTSHSNYYSKNALASISKSVGRHNITYGFDYRVMNNGPSISENSGAFTFNGVFSREYPTLSSTTTGSDFSDLLLGYPASGSAGTASPINVYVRYYAGYFQDDFRVNSKLTLNLGIRYEYETGESEVNNNMAVGFNQTQVNPIGAGVTGVIPYGVIQFAGVGGNPSACCNPSKTQFGPRFGMAYAATPKTTLRAGIGIFYAPVVFGAGDSVPGYTQSNSYVASNNGFVTPANSLSNPFPAGITQPTGNTLGPLTEIGQSFSVLDPNKAGGGTVYQYSADVQRDLGQAMMMEVGYFGSRSNGLTPTPTGTGTLPINELAPNYLALGQAALNAPVANPFYGQPGASGVIAAKTITRAQLLLPFPEYGAINLNGAYAHARYDSLVAKVQKRFSKGIQFLSTFTWSRNEDNEWGAGSGNSFNSLGGASTGGIQNIYNLNGEWGLSSIDSPLRWTGTWIYAFPFGKGRAFMNHNKVLDWIAGGWSINGTTIIQTGFPLFINQPNLNSNIGGTTQRPNATGVSPCLSGSPESRLGGYLNPAGFSLAPADTFGNVSRDISCLGPGQANWDTSLFKDFTVKERFTAELRLEALNTFNTPLFAAPITTFGTKTFGQVTYQANIPRELQLGLFLRW